MLNLNLIKTTMRSLVLGLCLLFATVCCGLPPTVTFDGRTLPLVENRDAGASAFIVYKFVGDGALKLEYQFAITRIKESPVPWPEARESMTKVLNEKAVLLPLMVRSRNSDSFILADYVHQRANSDVIEYAILKYFMTSSGALVAVDARIRCSDRKDEFLQLVRGRRESLARSFLEAAEPVHE